MYKFFVKPFLDILFSIVILILLFKLSLWFCLFLWIYYGCSPIFTQIRIGKNEKPFTIYKFRTMNEKKTYKGELLPDEERVSSIGSFIRRFGIDELPQVINILMGQMSFIGPRPLPAEYLPLYSQEIRKRHSVKPGITGLAQVNGANSLDWDKRFEFDLLYIKKITLWQDLKIAAKTINQLFSKSNNKNIGGYNPQK